MVNNNMVKESKNGTAKRMKVTNFFILTFLLSLPLYILMIFGHQELGVTAIFLIVFVPLISSLILTYRGAGSSGTKKLIKRSFDFRNITRKVWYAPILFLIPIVYISVFIILRLNGEALSESTFPLEFLPILLIMFFFMALGEEIGWMGYAYDPMEEQWYAFKASLVLGIIWAAWHIPIFIFGGHPLLWSAGQFLFLVGWRILIVWVYNNTGKSLFGTILFHTVGNVAGTILPILKDPLGPVISAVFVIIIIVFILKVWDFHTLTLKMEYRIDNNILKIFGSIALLLMTVGTFLNKSLYLLIPGGLLAIIFTLMYSKKMFSELDLEENNAESSKGEGSEGKLYLFTILCLIAVIIFGITGLLFLITGSITLVFSIILIAKNHKLLNKQYLFISSLLTIIVILTIQNKDLSWLILNTLITFFPFLGGIILVKKSNLEHNIISFDWFETIKKFSLGCLLALPIGFLNALALMKDDWITQWYHPLFAFKPAIFEEILIRLFLMVLIILFVNHYSSMNKKKIYIYSILTSGFVFSLLHGLNPINNLYLIIAFSIPSSILFLKVGLSCSIGNHFMIDFIRYLAYFLFVV
jgi:membrane protease YdiL (CAAX protease family)